LIGGYMVFYSIGSATGAIAATSLYTVAGWGAVCTLGTAFSCLGLVLWAFTRHSAPVPAAKVISRNVGSAKPGHPG
ncbi:MFS transporter, partial [Streptomyces lydicus]